MRHERHLLALIVAGLLLLVTLPYVYAYWVTPAGQVYTGLLWLPDDQNVHLTWAKQAAEGHFLFPNLYSADTIGHPPTFSNIVLWVVGTTARVTRVPLILVYHFYRLLFAGLAVVMFHRLTTLLTEDARVRLVATFLVAFSAGFGYVPVLLGMDTSHFRLMDLPRGYLFVPEAYTFTSALIYPLNVASLFLLATTYYYMLLSERTGRLRYAVFAGVAALVLGNSHTYDSLPLLTVLGLHLVLRAVPSLSVRAVRFRPAVPAMITLGMAAVPVVVQAWLYFFSEEFRWSKTHYPVSPLPVLPTLLSFGPVLPLAAYGAWLTRRQPASRLMTLWAGVTLVLMYAPGFDFGRKLIEGFQLPVAYLAAVAVLHIPLLIRSRRHRAGGFEPILSPTAGAVATRHADATGASEDVAAPRAGLTARAMLVAFFASTCLSLPLIVTAVLRHRTDTSWPAPRTPLDLPADYAAALDYLDRLPADQKATAVVLAMPPLSNHIPPRTGVHVFVGHWAESVRFVSKFWAAHHVFDGTMSLPDVDEFMAKNHITHLLVSPPTDPKAAVPPAERLGLSAPVFESHGTAVYAVPAGRGAP